MTKSNLHQKLFKTIKHLNKKTLLLTTKLLTVIVACSLLSNSMGLSELSFLPILPTINTESVQVLGSSLLGGSNTISIDKKYYNGTTEIENIKTLPSTTVTVRLKYSNTGNQSVQDAQISDSIPAGFTLNTNSFKNCLTPSVTETTCSSTFTPSGSVISGSNINISPVAGLYDTVSSPNLGGTAPSAISGVLEIGKKRYFYAQECTYVYNRGLAGQRFFSNIINSSYPEYQNSTQATNNPNYTPTCSGATTTTNQYGFALISEFTNTTKSSLLNNRYYHFNQCLYNNAADVGFFTSLVDSPYPEYQTGTQTNNNSNYAYTCPGSTTIPNQYGYVLVQNGYSGMKKSDLLGNRYFNVSQCVYFNNNISMFLSNYLNTIYPEYQNGTQANNNSSYTYTCPGSSTTPNQYGYSILDGYTGLQQHDLLDTTRSSGYIEYTMTASPTAGTYGTGVSLKDGTQNTIDNQVSTSASDVFVSGINNTITILSNSTSNITSSTCNPNTGATGYTTTCTANFADMYGTITFSSSLGSCTTASIQPTDTSASCSFVPTTGYQQPIITTAGAGIGISAGTLTATTIITNSDRTGGTCTPNSGLSGFVTTCTITFTTGKSGTVLFSFSAGSCTTPVIQPTDTSASCSFDVVGNGTFPVNYQASGSGTSTSLGVSLIPEQIDLSILKTSSGGSNSATNTIGTFNQNQNHNYTLIVKNNSLNYTSNSTLTVSDTIPIAQENYLSASGTGWNCNFVSPTLTCTSSTIIPANSNSNPITVNIKVL